MVRMTSAVTSVPTTATYNNLTYRGYYFDKELNMYYLQSRYYDSNICRFISADYPDILIATPVGLTDKNLYAYCDNNPVMRGDYDGECCNYVIGGIIGGISSAASSYQETGEVNTASVLLGMGTGATGIKNIFK